jgi:hypothetical protein
MPDSLIQLYTKQYSTNLEMGLQQDQSKLATRFMQGSHTGTMASPIDFLDAVEVREVSGRFEDIGRVLQEYKRRWLAPRSFDLPIYVDQNDLLKTIQDPNSALLMSQRAAFERNDDRRCIEAFFGDALTGNDGTTAVTWASEGANQIVLQTVGSSGGGTAVGLNVAKLRAARKILKQNFVDFDREEVFVGINAKADDDLLNEAQLISREYNEKLILKDGRIERFLGFTFVPTELLVTDGTYTRVPVWTSRGMHFGTWAGFESKVSTDITKQGHPYQLYAKKTANATRLDPKRVVEIKITAS